MDLEGDCSAPESVEDNELMTRSLESASKTKIENNGICLVEHEEDKLVAKTKFEGVAVRSPSPPVPLQSPQDSKGSSPPASAKGYGLKKWRRIKREGSKDGGSYSDTSKVLKRGLSNSVGNSMKPLHMLDEMKQKSVGSILSTNAIVNVPSSDTVGLASNGDSGLVRGPVFATGTDSVNSKDPSSKSLTAASGPKLRSEVPGMLGYEGDRNRIRNLSGKGLGSSVPRSAQLGKGRIESSKKPRGERIKVEKENSHSSMESDSRSSNFVFVQGTNSLAGNGKQSGRSANYDGENSDDARDGERNFGQDTRTGYNNDERKYENASQEDLAAELSWESKEERTENYGLSTDHGPLLESILSLQYAQEALETEVEKLRCIGKEDTSPFDIPVQANGFPSEFISEQELHQRNFSDSLESRIIDLKQNIIFLQNKLKESNFKLELEEAKAIELEAIISSRTEESLSTSKNYDGLVTELEGLLRQRIETEIEYWVVSAVVQELRATSMDQMLSEQRQFLSKLEEDESKARMLERKAEELESWTEEIVETDEVLKLQNRVCRFTFCFLIQVVLLFVILTLFVLQLSPPRHGEVVPT